MKNKEAIRKAVVKPDSGNFCEDFIEKKILSNYGLTCGDVNCNQCRIICALWLDEEYIEPDEEDISVEAGYVEVPDGAQLRGTTVQVSNDGNTWYDRVYYQFNPNSDENKYWVYSDVCDTNSSMSVSGWKYCRLPLAEYGIDWSEMRGKRVMVSDNGLTWFDMVLCDYLPNAKTYRFVTYNNGDARDKANNIAFWKFCKLPEE